MHARRILLSILLPLIFAASAHACLWDYDTLREERRGMPGIAEVLAGQWERHSAFFYHHRIEAMTTLLATRPDDWDAMDNLAVAYAKLGQNDTAVAVMLDKEKRHPGQYTTASNLGTFYMFKGDLPRAIGELKKALAINPNAHFGREEYQLQLAKFLQQVETQPELRDDDFLNLRKLNFRNPDGTFQRDDDGGLRLNDRLLRVGCKTVFDNLHLKANVFDGIVGMIRFGTDQSADLYFSLGDLLAVHGQRNLAYRAYEHVLELGYPRPDAVHHAMDLVTSVEVPKAGFDPAVIAAEDAAGTRWVADYQAFEDDLIRAGKSTDNEANYAPFCATHSRTLATRSLFIADLWTIYGNWAIAISGIVGLVVFEAWRVRRRKRRAAEPPAPPAAMPMT